MVRGPEGDDPAVVLSGIDRLYNRLVEDEVSVYETHALGSLPDVLVRSIALRHPETPKILSKC